MLNTIIKNEWNIIRRIRAASSLLIALLLLAIFSICQSISVFTQIKQVRQGATNHMRQNVGIAIALAKDAKMILMDEPTRRTIMMATHDISNL